MNELNNQSFWKAFVLRFLGFFLPLLALYVYAQYAFYENNLKEHPTDAGLGIALLLFFISVILFGVFLVDAIRQLRRKNYAVLWIDVAFLSIFLIPILYVGLMMGW